MDITTFSVDANTTVYADIITAQTSLCQYICTRAYESMVQFERLTAPGATIYAGGVPVNLAQLAQALSVFGNAYAADTGLTSIPVAAGVMPAPGPISTFMPIPPTADANAATETANATA